IGRLDPVAVMGRWRHVGNEKLAPCLPVDLAGVVVRLVGGTRRHGEHFGIDEMPAPLACNQEALVDELLEGQNDGAACHAQLFREHPAGGQRHGRSDLAVEDGGDDRLPDLRLKGLAGIRRDAEKPRPDRRVASLWHGALLAGASDRKAVSVETAPMLDKTFTARPDIPPDALRPVSSPTLAHKTVALAQRVAPINY